MNFAPPINEVVAFLDKFSPATLHRLQKELPQLKEQLEPGGIAGPAHPQVLARAKVSLATLHEVKILCNRGINEAQQRLKLAKSLTLAGSITAAVGSAAVITTLAASYPLLGMLSGIISLIGSMAVLFSDFIAKIPKAGKSLFDIYQTLTGVRVEAGILERELEILLSHNPEEEDEALISEIVGKSNLFLKQSYDLMSELESVIVAKS